MADNRKTSGITLVVDSSLKQTRGVGNEVTREIRVTRTRP